MLRNYRKKDCLLFLQVKGFRLRSKWTKRSISSPLKEEKENDSFRIKDLLTCDKRNVGHE